MFQIILYEELYYLGNYFTAFITGGFFLHFKPVIVRFDPFTLVIFYPAYCRGGILGGWVFMIN